MRIHDPFPLDSNVAEADIMTSAILFAMVDAVLRAKERRARAICGMSQYAETRWERSKRAIGWWRSTW